jgi:hypothetical protein
MIASVSPASMLGGLPNITALRLLKVWVLLAPEECPPLLHTRSIYLWVGFRSATPRLLAPAVTHPGLSDGELAPFPTLPGMNRFGIRSGFPHLLARMGAPLLRHVASWHRGLQQATHYCLHYYHGIWDTSDILPQHPLMNLHVHEGRT